MHDAGYIFLDSMSTTIDYRKAYVTYNVTVSYSGPREKPDEDKDSLTIVKVNYFKNSGST